MPFSRPYKFNMTIKMTLATTQISIKKWHQMLETNDMSILNDLLADEVVFRSPVAY